MDYIQPILVYLLLAIAVAYLVKKFLLPKKFLSHKKSSSKGCGNDNCGCS